MNERRSDIPLLSQHFIKDICAGYNIKVKPITNEALEELKKLHWTGNVRELRNVIERLIILSESKITGEDVRLYVIPTASDGKKNQNLYDRFNHLQEFKEYTEKAFLENKLMRNSWNISKNSRRNQYSKKSFIQ